MVLKLMSSNELHKLLRKKREKNGTSYAFEVATCKIFTWYNLHAS
jgi:hypothetical protein